jgi:hypothetical protein
MEHRSSRGESTWRREIITYAPQPVLDAQGNLWLGTGGAVVRMSGTVALIPYRGDAPVNPS